jgi:hypothetical protein
MRVRLVLASILAAALAGGCGDDDPGPGPVTDGGDRDAAGGRDSGPGPGIDGGPGTDTGPRPDGGPIADAGPTDGAPVSMPCMARGLCDPFDPASCPMGDVCLPGGDAGAACATASMTMRMPDEMCTGPDQCPPGYMCISFGGSMFNCRRMCPEGSIGFCGGELRCIGVIGDECVRVCRERSEPCDIYTQDCADPAEACTFVTDGETGMPYTGCRTEGTLGPGEACGGGMGGCSRGLVCIRTGDTTTACRQVCRPMGTPACAAGQMCTGLARTWMVSYCEDSS